MRWCIVQTTRCCSSARETTSPRTRGGDVDCERLAREVVCHPLRCCARVGFGRHVRAADAEGRFVLHADEERVADKVESGAQRFVAFGDSVDRRLERLNVQRSIHQASRGLVVRDGRAGVQRGLEPHPFLVQGGRVVAGAIDRREERQIRACARAPGSESVVQLAERRGPQQVPDPRCCAESLLHPRDHADRVQGVPS